jgi:hypothetical protein
MGGVSMMRWDIDCGVAERTTIFRFEKPMNGSLGPAFENYDDQNDYLLFRCRRRDLDQRLGPPRSIDLNRYRIEHFHLRHYFAVFFFIRLSGREEAG